MKDEHQTFQEHLQEMMKRLSLAGIFFAVGMLVGFIWYKPFSHLLTKPLGETLYFTSPIGGLNYVMFISMALGLAVALPMLVYQLVQFIRPVHEKITTAAALKIMTASVVMAALGVTYAYLVGLPAALKFLMGVGGQDLTPIITTNDYISFLTAYLLGTAFIFQLPVILFFIDRIRPIPPGFIKRAQKPVIVASFIVGAMITPTPDPFNQLMVTLPMILLFESSAFIISLSHRRKARREQPNAAVSPKVAPTVTPQSAPQESLAFMPAPATSSARPIQSQASMRVTRTELSRAKAAEAHVIDLSNAKVTHVVRRGPKRRYQLPSAHQPMIDIYPTA